MVPVPEVLCGYEDLPAVAALWIIFGTSDHKTPPPGLVVENYTWRRTLPRPIWAWKSIVDPRRTRRARTAHEFRYTDPGVRKPVPAFASLDDLRLNHYITRSEQELKAKLAAPEAATGGLRKARIEDLLRPIRDASRRRSFPMRRPFGAPSMPGDQHRGRPPGREPACVTNRTQARPATGSVRLRSKRAEESWERRASAEGAKHVTLGRGGAAKFSLPPGPRTPSLFQTMGWWMRPISFLERNRARYGKRFTIRLLGERVFVMLSDPADVKQIYTSPPDVLHPGEGARILAPVVGQNSVILLDGDTHLEQRKLMLPAFHGEKMQALSGLMREVAEREAEGWPRDEPVALHPRLQRLTLEVILRAVFGLDPGPRLDGLRERLTRILEMGSTPITLLPFLQQELGGRGPGPGSCACGRSPTR